jgi:hypothetical protein
LMNKPTTNNTWCSHYKNTGQLPGANPLGNSKKPWETHFYQGICQGRALEYTSSQIFCQGLYPCEISQGHTPVKFARDLPLWNKLAGLPQLTRSTLSQTVSVLAMPGVLPLGNVNSFFFNNLNHFPKINIIFIQNT